MYDSWLKRIIIQDVLQLDRSLLVEPHSPHRHFREVRLHPVDDFAVFSHQVLGYVRRDLGVGLREQTHTVVDRFFQTGLLIHTNVGLRPRGAQSSFGRQAHHQLLCASQHYTQLVRAAAKTQHVRPASRYSWLRSYVVLFIGINF